MSRSSKASVTVYRSFEQFKADLFPASIAKTEKISTQDVHNLAIHLAEASFNKVLRVEKRPKRSAKVKD